MFQICKLKIVSRAGPPPLLPRRVWLLPPLRCPSRPQRQTQLAAAGGGVHARYGPRSGQRHSCLRCRSEPGFFAFLAFNLCI